LGQRGSEIPQGAEEIDRQMKGDKMYAGKYFKISEFDDPTLPGSGDRVSSKLIMLLNQIREKCDFPFFITSGYRTEAHNRDVGGGQYSEHLDGLAVDISAPGSRQKFAIVQAALEFGINRIGIGANFVHLGIDESKVRNVIWIY
jgi:hypothetical protein